jgi:hypothetical protein
LVRCPWRRFAIGWDDWETFPSVAAIPDPLERMVEVFRLDGDGYRLVVTRGGTDRVRLEAFGAVEIELEALWPTPLPEPK